MYRISILLAVSLTGLAFPTPCEKMGTGTGLVSNFAAFFEGRPEPVPIFSQTLSFQPLVFGGEGQETGQSDPKPKGEAASHYLVVFGSQSDPPVARRSHTFACLVKARGGPEDRKILETVTISWLPKSLNVAVARVLPEEGVNLDLLPTLKWARDQDTQVSAWGPYRVKKELYDRARSQKARLESGAVSYKAIDLKAPITPPVKPLLKAPLKAPLKSVLQREDHVNCIHAVSDIAGSDLATGTAYGVAASAMVVRHLQPWMINPEQTHPWVIDAIGLKEQPIRFQKEKKGS
jgi:hypothetical protein